MFTLESLGLSQSELQERVVAHIANLILASSSYDEDGNPEETASKFKRQIVELVQKKANEKIAALAAEHVLPKVSDFVENLTLRQTNEWGERKPQKPPITFIEYLIQRAEAYIMEEVDGEGRSRAECQARGNSFYGKGQPRLTLLVNNHLAESIKQAMVKAVQTAHGSLAEALEKTAKLKLAEICEELTVKVTTN